MKILHLYSNHKWTGPAELALQQVAALNRQTGVTATLALAGHHDPNRPHAVEARAKALGVPMRRGLALRRHFQLRALVADAGELGRWLKAGDYDRMHCHQSGDHLVAALAMARSGVRVPLLRSYWEHAPPGAGPRARFSFQRTDQVIAAFQGQREGLARYARRLCVIPPILGATPMPKNPAAARRQLRGELKLPEHTLLVGLTARIQPRRRWDLCWDVMAQLASRYDHIHLCILGRPDAGVFDRLCARPLAEKGLSDRVHFLGYRKGADYFQALAAFDAFLFLVPGSDATCRALREAMALGLAPAVTGLGYLPEIVRDGVTGYVRPEDPTALAEALGDLLTNPALRHRLGREAARAASDDWQTSQQGQWLVDCYRRLEPRSASIPQ